VSRTPTFAGRALATLDISVEIPPCDLESIPRSGPLVIAANHPHGIIDGLVLADAIERVRPDVRALANHLLAYLPGVAELCVFVDPFGGPRSVSRSHRGLRRARQWLDDGRALIVFPAGAVAHAWANDELIDSPWHPTVGRLALRTGAAVAPAFIAGHNSTWFYRAGRLHPSLRTAMLVPELLTHRGRRVKVRIGHAVFSSALPESRDGVAATASIRSAADRLRAATAASLRSPRRSTSHVDGSQARSQQARSASCLPGSMESEVASLRAGNRLLLSGAFEVFCAEASRIPNLLQEIGRLREITFSAVGEGTGRDVDLDRFDEHYLHLFVWNTDAREVVGAYRLGLTDRILAEHGVSGLYTSTLFRYDRRLLDALPPAIELGRSFVRAGYQRSSSALMLLWKGIAQWVLRAGRYRVLFGPVSISRRYRDTSQQLLRDFLVQNRRDHALATLVQAVNPPADVALPVGIEPRVATDLSELDALIARLEDDGKGMPVLLRQYLKLSARLLGFNVDPGFGDALDALMAVDLADVEPAVLRRYFGSHAAVAALGGPRQVGKNAAAA
jgi:putative hemolysin